MVLALGSPISHLSLSRLCLSPPSPFFLSPLLFFFGTFLFSAPSVSPPYFGGVGEESAHLFLFPVSSHQSLLPLPLSFSASLIDISVSVSRLSVSSVSLCVLSLGPHASLHRWPGLALSPAAPAPAAGRAAVSWRADNLAAGARRAASVRPRGGGGDVGEPPGAASRTPGGGAPCGEGRRSRVGEAARRDAGPVPAGVCSGGRRSPRALGCGLGAPAAGRPARRGAARPEESRARVG